MSGPSTFQDGSEIFTTHDVNAIGLKLGGDEGSSLADPLAMSLMDSAFHACGQGTVLFS